MKNIEIKIKVPNDWIKLNELEILTLIGDQFKDHFKKAVLSQAIGKAVNHLKIPEIKIDPVEIKNRMIDIIARESLERNKE